MEKLVFHIDADRHLQYLRNCQERNDPWLQTAAEKSVDGIVTREVILKSLFEKGIQSRQALGTVFISYLGLPFGAEEAKYVALLQKNT